MPIGDIRSGKQTCSYGYDQGVYNIWLGFQSPLVYTPGDNEWAGCHKTKEGSQLPMDNLGYVRSIFFSNPGHIIAGDKQVMSQANDFDPSYPGDAATSRT